MFADPSFRTDYGLVQAKLTGIPANTPRNYWNIQQDLFPSYDLTNSLNFAFMCTSGTSDGASSVPGDSQCLFSPVMAPTYHQPVFPSDPALFNFDATDGLDLDPTILAD